jgi:NhaP-type Na+/H+ or K+/H+ antiporter
MEEFAIMISMLATLFGAYYYYMNTRHKERMALIDSGADASLFYSSKKKPQGGMISFFLGLGIVSVSLSIGILLALFLERLFRAMDGRSRGDYEEVYVIMVFLSIGTGLIISYFVIKKLIKKEELEEAEREASK